MTNLKSKTRVITFRVSEEEHQLLIHACTQKRCRSVSEYARETVIDDLQHPGTPAALLGSNLAMLKSDLERLHTALTAATDITCRVLGVSPSANKDSSDLQQTSKAFVQDHNESMIK